MLYDDSSSGPRGWLSLLNLFEQFAESSKPYLQYDNGYRTWKYTYAQVAAAARHFAARLRTQGICKGDKVIIWSENRPEWISAFWGCLLEGVVVVPIDYRSSAGFLMLVHEIVHAHAILIGEEVQLPAWEQQPPVWKLSELDWPEAIAAGSPTRIGKDDVAEVVFTSGATGEPKGVLITHRNILANMVSPEQIVARYRKWFRLLLPVRFLTLIPLSHMFGQAVTIFLVPLIPGGAVFMHGYSPHEILRQIRTQRVSVVIAVPKLLEVLREYVIHRFPEVADDIAAAGSHWILRWWRYRKIHRWFGWKFWAFLVGAAPLPSELEQFWSRLGFAVIQGYGLTETAPIVAFNNPFDIRKGTVGRPVAGLEVRIAADGEILVRGESVTKGYYQNHAETAKAFEGGWFHTGDIGSIDDGRLTIRGRKKEMIATPEGLKVFPEDVERILNRMPGVRESAVVGLDRVHAVLALGPGGDPGEIVRLANLQLEDHQKIREVSIWPGDLLPRTEGTQKIKHVEIQRWVETGRVSAPAVSSKANVVDLVQKHAPGRSVTPQTTLDELGLSSLDRVELMMDLEERFDMSVDESILMSARTVAELAEASAAPPGLEFPVWNRSPLARLVRRTALAFVLLPLTRFFSRLEVSGEKNFIGLQGPVIFASNHQSHLDTPSILASLPAPYRNHMAVAMWKEYFDAHFFPECHTRREWLLSSLSYWLVALFFNAFPIPQTEAGAGQSLRYIGELVSQQWSILFFPEGQRTEAGEISPFQEGIGLIASRLGVPIVPIRLRGLETVLHRHARWPRPARVELVFGSPLHLKGRDYKKLAKQVEEAVAAL